MLEKMQIKQLRNCIKKLKEQNNYYKERADKAEAALGELFRAKERLEAETKRLSEVKDSYSDFTAELKHIKKEILEKK